MNYPDIYNATDAELRAFCEWNDSNGEFADMTRADMVACILLWMDDNGIAPAPDAGA